MYPWLLERDDKLGYDETHGVVIAADTAQEAQELSANVGGDQPASIWFAPTTTIRAVGIALPGVEKGIILRDFNAG
jgi:hypothetical protein